MTTNRKAQSATEWLMTYGWAILAIAIVGALLYTQVYLPQAYYEPNQTQNDNTQFDTNKCMRNCDCISQDICINCVAGICTYTYHRYKSDIEDCNLGVMLLEVTGATPEQISVYDQSCLQAINDAYWSEYSDCVKGCVGEVNSA